jgi:hypothetical protein
MLFRTSIYSHKGIYVIWKRYIYLNVSIIFNIDPILQRGGGLMKSIFLDKKELEEDIYSEAREQMLEEDEVAGWEEAFMRGYEEAG